MTVPPLVPGVLKLLARKIPKIQKTINANFSGDVSHQSLVDQVRDLQQAVLELQSRSFASKDTTTDGLPAHGSPCTAIDGQYIRLNQTAAAPFRLLVEHGLGRIPQGVLSIRAANNARIFPEGQSALGILPADERTVTLELNGSINERQIVVIF